MVCFFVFADLALVLDRRFEWLFRPLWPPPHRALLGTRIPRWLRSSICPGFNSPPRVCAREAGGCIIFRLSRALQLVTKEVCLFRLLLFICRRGIRLLGLLHAEVLPGVLSAFRGWSSLGSRWRTRCHAASNVLRFSRRTKQFGFLLWIFNFSLSAKLL